MPWESIRYVTGPLTLCAFLVLAILFCGVRPFLKERKNVKGFFRLLERKLRGGELFWLLLVIALIFFAIYVTSVIADIYTRPSEFQTIDVQIECNGEIVPAAFVLKYSLPGQPPQEAKGQFGSANILNVPTTLNSVTILDLQLEGYRILKPGSVRLEGKLLRLSVEATSLPSFEDYPEVPTAYLSTQAEQPDALVDPSKILFHIDNLTGERIWVCLYNQDAEGFQARWITISDFTQPFSRFHPGDGWYVVFARSGPGRYQCLGTVNLFVSEDPQLVISRTAIQYVGDFKNVKRSSNSCR